MQVHCEGVMHIPRLYSDLKIALATLYSIPVSSSCQHPTTSTTTITQEQAHEFLLNFQSQNIRRMILSFQQKHRDQQQNQNQQQQQQSRSNKNENNDVIPMTSIPMGSSWLASLALLCSCYTTDIANHDNNILCIAATPTERLFAAQTLLFRLRRAKMIESIDLEMEQSEDADYATCLRLYQNNQHVIHMVPFYKEWMKSINPFVGHVLDSYQTPDPNRIQTAEDEERMKGEITLVTLAAISYYIAAVLPQTNETLPIISTCMSAFITAAIRIRFTPTSIATNDGVSPNTFPLVTTVQKIFDFIWQNAVAYQQTIPPDHAALISVLHVCLGCIPDTVMGSPGGGRGRLSVDLRCLQAVIQELRMVDIALLSDIFRQSAASDVGLDAIRLDLVILQTCTKWASFLQLTEPLLQMAIAIVKQFLTSNEISKRKAASEFLIALYEGGSWTVDQILSTNVGLTNQQHQASNQQSTKKKQSNKSKKRQKDIVEQTINDLHFAQAHEEMRMRGEIACQATIMVWETLSTQVENSLEEYCHHVAIQVDGEGPLGCLAECANACLPHILRYPACSNGCDLFVKITIAFQGLCSSPNKTVRALSYEPLHTLHSALIDPCIQEEIFEKGIESNVIDHFFKCTMNLASVCGYPEDYFDYLGAPSDEELEIERNDVRDLLRTVSGHGDLGPQVLFPICTQKILFRILLACREVISLAKEKQQIFPETAAHAFSSLAKPLNQVAKYFSECRDSQDTLKEILTHALAVLLDLNSILIEAFHRQLPPKQLLPLSRVVNIAVASLSPMLSFILGRPTQSNSDIVEAVTHVLIAAIHSAILSLEYLPELFEPSILDNSMYEIRGAMRGPGGEDHVGCLALMRLASESDTLVPYVATAITPFVPRLCTLHQALKELELKRGKGCFHGSRGVTPQSRRILVNALGHLELKSSGKLGASAMLTDLFNSALDTIIACQAQTWSEHSLFQMTESTFDLASFPPAIVASLFDENSGQNTACLRALTNACVSGYHVLSTKHEIDETVVQWNRLRAALFMLLRLCANADIPKRSSEMLITCIIAECEAVRNQCFLGPTSQSSIFHDRVITGDGIPAGLFIKILADVASTGSSSLEQVLRMCKETILMCITLPCPDPADNAFVDPRPNVAESWFLLMIGIMERNTVDNFLELVLIDTCVATVSLLFNPSKAKTRHDRRKDPGMSLDGPHSRTAITFLERFFHLGPNVLMAVGEKLLLLVPIDVLELNQWCGDKNIYGISILGASLFRANQGSLPPWAAESIPDLYSAFFHALNKDVAILGTVIRLSMEIKLSSTAPGSFGSVQPGQLLSGHCFGGMSEHAKQSFWDDFIKLCQKDDAASWRRMKALVKQVCGGKKKETDFGQKPPLTKWDFFRV